MSGRVVVAHEDEAWRQWTKWRAHFPQAIRSAPTSERDWKAAWRLVQLVDNADLFLARSRGDRWLDRYADVSGHWPAQGPFIAVTAHWGAGLWALRHLGRSGRCARFLSGRFSKDSFPGDRARLRYVRARVGAVEKATRGQIIYTGGAIAEMAATWNAGNPVVALYDVGGNPQMSSVRAPLGDIELRMPYGLIRQACERAIPVVPFRCGVDRARGRRHIRIDEAHVFTDEEELSATLAAQLDALLADDAVAWHMWPYADQLFVAPSDATVGATDSPSTALP